MSTHKVGDLLYGPMTGLGMIIRIDSEDNNGGYPYVVEWYTDKYSTTVLPSYHYHAEIEYYKKCLVAEQQ